MRSEVPASVWMMSGTALLAVVAAIVASRLPEERPRAAFSGLPGVQADTCFSYGRFECCVKDE